MTGLADLRHRMRLEAPVDVDDGAGGSERNWTAVAMLWARLEALEARERVTAGRIEAAVSHRLTIRRRQDLSHQMRFVLDARTFEIRGIADDGISGFSGFVTCFCEEIAA